MQKTAALVFWSWYAYAGYWRRPGADETYPDCTSVPVVCETMYMISARGVAALGEKYIFLCAGECLAAVDCLERSSKFASCQHGDDWTPVQGLLYLYWECKSYRQITLKNLLYTFPLTSLIMTLACSPVWFFSYIETSQVCSATSNYPVRHILSDLVMSFFQLNFCWTFYRFTLHVLCD